MASAIQRRSEPRPSRIRFAPTKRDSPRRSGWHPRYGAGRSHTPSRIRFAPTKRAGTRRSGWHPRYSAGRSHPQSRLRFAPTKRDGPVGADGIRDTAPVRATPIANTIRSYQTRRTRRSGWHPRYSAGRSHAHREYDSLLQNLMCTVRALHQINRSGR